MAKLTALGHISDLCSTAGRCAASYDKAPVNMKSYREGEAVAYAKAHEIMKVELQRLRNLLQNGCLTQADFGEDLPY